VHVSDFSGAPSASAPLPMPTAIVLPTTVPPPEPLPVAPTPTLGPQTCPRDESCWGPTLAINAPGIMTAATDFNGSSQQPMIEDPSNSGPSAPTLVMWTLAPQSSLTPMLSPTPLSFPASASVEAPKSSAPSDPTAPTAPRIRLQARIHKLKIYSDDTVHYPCIASSTEPHSLQEALSSPSWKAAMHEECNALLRNKIWRLVPPKT
jgi:hypothetical protein